MRVIRGVLEVDDQGLPVIGAIKEEVVLKKQEFLARLRGMGACLEGYNFTREYASPQAAWSACTNPSWMLWYLYRRDGTCDEARAFWNGYERGLDHKRSLQLDRGLYASRVRACNALRSRWPHIPE